MARPALLDVILNPLRRNAQNSAPTDTIGAPGIPIYGGYIDDNEVESKLKGREKYRTYSRLLANTSIVASGVRFFLNLASSVEWSVVASESDKDDKYKELVEKALFEMPSTPWHRVVRRAAMYRFYGFSMQEWTAGRHDEGFIGFADVAPRAQITIERWDVDRNSGQVIGCIQRDPYDNAEIYLPRDRLLYLVDDSLNDSPEGLGLFRHIVRHAERLEEYERLEGVGYANDLRGIPIARGPFEEINAAVQAGNLSRAKADQLIRPLKAFITNHTKTGQTSMMVDSAVYETTDEKQTPTSNKKWDIDIIKSPGISPMAEMAQAINRVNMEIARILGVEGLLLGSGKQGSYALSKDKSQNFFLIVEGTLRDIRESCDNDLIKRMWDLNGFPPEMMPKVQHGKVQYQDAQDVAETLAAMARAGAPLEPNDPIINEVRHMLGLSETEARTVVAEADAELRSILDRQSQTEGE